MLEHATTFVIGAGASFDLGFPLGDSLRTRITDVLGVDEGGGFTDVTLSRIIQDRSIQEAGVSSWPHRAEEYLRAAAAIRNGLPFARSIDTFIDGLRDVDQIEFLSKLAIALVILRAEQASPLDQRPIHAANAVQLRQARLTRLLASWHTELSQILYDGHSRQSLPAVFNHASFIVFNYDRCIEEFLTVSLMRRFRIDRNEALTVVSTCSIIHPYGTVGSFFPDQDGFVPFGDLENCSLVPIASALRTYTETMESEAGERIKDMVAGADRLVFMGFGWLPQNMGLLSAQGRLSHVQQVFATTMNMERGEVEVVRDQILEILRRGRHAPHYDEMSHHAPDFVFERGDCKALMNNCWLRLTQRSVTPAADITIA